MVEGPDGIWMNQCSRCGRAVPYVRADNGVCADCDMRDSLAEARAERDTAYSEVRRLQRHLDEARAEIERLRARIERARALCEQAFPERKQYVSLATIIAALDGES